MSNERTATNELERTDEELVAYLDGELAVEERGRLERRLADDEGFRARLKALQRTWDALDMLGRADPDEGFTRTTVELVAIKAAADVQDETARTTRRRTWGLAVWSAGALAAAAAGYFVLSQQLGREDRELVRDLPVIERVDEYRSADSVEFVKALEESGLFAAEPENES